MCVLSSDLEKAQLQQRNKHAESVCKMTIHRAHTQNTHHIHIHMHKQDAQMKILPIEPVVTAIGFLTRLNVGDLQRMYREIVGASPTTGENRRYNRGECITGIMKHQMELYGYPAELPISDKMDLCEVPRTDPVRLPIPPCKCRCAKRDQATSYVPAENSMTVETVGVGVETRSQNVATHAEQAAVQQQGLTFITPGRSTLAAATAFAEPLCMKQARAEHAELEEELKRLQAAGERVADENRRLQKTVKQLTRLTTPSR